MSKILVNGILGFNWLLEFCMKRLLSLIKVFSFLLLTGTGIVTLLALWYIKDLPNPERLLAQGPAQSTKIYDRTGRVLLYQIGDEKRSVVSLDQLPAHARWATLVAEDADFYNHPGIDVTGIVRAAWRDITSRSFEQGGSTITQQFVKNALLSPEKTISRKFKEMILSIWVETRYSKDQIFGFYLNQIPYGGNTYGIEQASRIFFGKSASDLTIAQAALLASLPQRPNYLSPYGNHKNELTARKNMILDKMAHSGYIAPAQKEEAKKETLIFRGSVGGSLLAPHFVMYIKEYLEKTYGSEVVERGGLEVITTIDMRIQKKAEESVFAIAKKNEKQRRAKNAALVALDPKTGQVLAMVGSRDWFEDSIDGKVNVALRLRQPGSSFKPIAYAKLFEDGFDPGSLLLDLRTTFKTRDGQPYTPINFDGRYHGLLTVRQALAQSINVAAVKALYLSGIDNVVGLAKKMGVGTIDSRRVDLAVVLGGAEVRLLDLTGAYSVFANNGVFNKPRAILRVRDNQGMVLEEFKNNPEKVLKPEVTRLITSILSDNNARAPIFGLSSPIYVPGVPSAVKTGTTSDFRDGWTMGYTPNLVVGVWAGNNDNSPTYQGEGAFIAGPIWHSVVKYAASTYPSEFGGSFPPLLPHAVLKKPMANGVLILEKEILVDKTTGQPSSFGTPVSDQEKRIQREVHSELYYIRPRDPQLGAWEGPVKQWAATKTDLNLSSSPPPQKNDTPLAPPPKVPPTITLLNLKEGQEIDPSFSLQFAFNGVLPIKQIDVFLDDQLLTSVNESPAILDLLKFSEGEHIMKIRGFDQALNTSEKDINIILKKNNAGDQ